MLPFNRYLLKLQSEELQIHATEITDVRKAVEREKLSRESLERHILPNQKTYRKNTNPKNRYRNNGEHNSFIKNPSKQSEGDNLLFETTSTTEGPLSEVDIVTGKNSYHDYARELTVQHKTTLSEVRQLRTKIAESLGEHHNMQRSIDELKTEVRYCNIAIYILFEDFAWGV